MKYIYIYICVLCVLYKDQMQTLGWIEVFQFSEETVNFKVNMGNDNF